MELFYRSTRNSEIRVKASEAILKGLSDDGGLFVPESFPKLQASLQELAEMDYAETAYCVMKPYLSDFTEEELKDCIAKAYDEKFDTPVIAPLVEAGGAYYLELFHGKTIAFKDMALSILPHLMTVSAKKNQLDKEIVILTATSGDTGKAALAGFADVPGTRIIVFYPKDGVSPIQKLQMVTEKGKNTLVVGVNGNFDDCQTGVKKLFSDRELEQRINSRGFCFSSANSINIGRLLPQTAYYVYAYSRLLKEGRIKDGEGINFVVPTGNFGNILAAWYAMKMGLPVKKLICASNENKVLYDFFSSGKYDRNREFVLTSSPSMDILISSNLERLIYHIAGDDAGKNSELMEELKRDGMYEITPSMEKELSCFKGYFADEAETADKIRSLYEDTGYVIDTHTAVAAASYDKYLSERSDDTTTVIVSTASPFKFARSVVGAIRNSDEVVDDMELVDILSEISGVDIPPAVRELKEAEICHKTNCEICDMMEIVEGFL